MTNFSKKILEEDLIHAIQQFHKYANIYPTERNNCVIDVLKEMLIEAEKMQTEWSKLEEEV